MQTLPREVVYRFPNGNSPVPDWFRSQDPKVKAKFSRIFDLLQEQGTSVGKPKDQPKKKGKGKIAMTTTSTIAWDSIRDEILADPEVQAEYDALETEFNIARHIIALRKASGTLPSVWASNNPSWLALNPASKFQN
jgi:hypothetical protein